MTCWYNDNDPYVCAWLRELIAAGHLPEGKVDERSILDIRPTDCGDTCHFFAGIGGWPLALRLAGWPDARPVWTGSCPCPPFSAAGTKRCPKCAHRGLGFFAGSQSVIQEFGCGACGWRDERNLWPELRRLIEVCRPRTVFGEQVASALGREWFAGIRTDLDRLGYTCTAVDLCAAGVGAPHIRSRIFWVAGAMPAGRPQGRPESGSGQITHGSATNRVADAGSIATGNQQTRTGASPQPLAASGGSDGGVAESAGARRTAARSGPEIDAGRQPEPGRASGGMGNADEPGPQGHGNPGQCSSELSAWARSEAIYCRDGKWRRIPLEPAFQPLAPGLSAGRVGILRGAGNSIVPQVAAEFIRAVMG
jgi:DNA (cytosine-5)-methyltransferase 1